VANDPTKEVPSNRSCLVSVASNESRSIGVINDAIVGCSAWAAVGQASTGMRRQSVRSLSSGVALPAQSWLYRSGVGSAFVEPPRPEIEGCLAAHAKLADVVAGLDDELVHRPSLLPDWTVAHVLTHLARNAEAMHRRIEAALRGEQIDQYEGGAVGRAASIDAGARRNARELEVDVVDWSQRLDMAFASLPSDGWSRMVRSVAGGEYPVSALPFRRWREVEIHIVDLNVGLTAADWPDRLVELSLPRLLSGLSERADERELMAWALGRGPAPELEVWG
jgi:maleylpyruvate isomerase